MSVSIWILSTLGNIDWCSLGYNIASITGLLEAEITYYHNWKSSLTTAGKLRWLFSNRMTDFIATQQDYNI